MNFYPYQKKKGGGAGKVLAMLKEGGGGTKCFEVVLTHKLEVLVILKEGAKGSSHQFLLQI